MSINYPYYLPLSPALYEAVRFLGISPKTERVEDKEQQKTDKDGTPVWVISALVKFQGRNPETETFTLVASKDVAAKINTIEELTPVRLVGLEGGKWSKSQTDKTSWSFQVSAIELVKS